ncbi:MAG TPA: FHA domain-containing protein [Victivallales bacterium]|nr:FHA domain-containing protein [Victivallales bacterium]HPO89967.1 FHA domain-containing protein [Victivallales bacterium]HRU01104.1 FHA domain-containing protein [Victivallales bacterium]
MKLFFSGAPKSNGFVELNPPGLSIGRELDNDVIIESESASRYHCKISYRDGNWYLKDLNSTNGTKLNGLKITDEVKLNEGDVISIGYQKLTFGEKIPVKNEEKKLESELSSPVKDKEKREDNTTEPQKKGDTSPQSFFGSLFSSGDKKDDEPEKSKFFQKERIENKNEGQNKKHASVMFYVIVLLFAFILVSGFLLIEKVLNEEKVKNQSQRTKTSDSASNLTVIYEKQITTPDNIFRYELKIKNNKIQVTRDDLKHSIRFRREQELKPELIENLKNELKETDFMNVSEPQAGISPDNSDETKILTITYGSMLNTVRVKNTFEPTAFRDAVNVLESFSNNVLNIPTISLTPEEMKKEAEDTFAKAEMLFANKNARKDNLKEAIKRYSYVIELLEFFEPKPSIYDQAYKQSQEAKKMLDEEVKQYEIKAQQARRMQRLEEAIEAYRSIMEMLDSEDKRYQNARDSILKLEEAIRLIKKGKKK